MLPPRTRLWLPGDGTEGLGCLVCQAVWRGWRLPTFRQDVLPSVSADLPQLVKIMAVRPFETSAMNPPTQFRNPQSRIPAILPSMSWSSKCFLPCRFPTKILTSYLTCMLHVRPTKLVKILLLCISLWKASSCLILYKNLTFHSVDYLTMSHRLQKLV